jgi:formylglycine-generating enzyme required for sulfatase activity
VWQWCADDYYAKERTVLAAHLVGLLGGPFGQGPFLAASGLSRPDQVVDLEASYRVYRGGSWIINAGHCRAANRLGFTPVYRSHYLGFRLARVPVR